MQKYDRPATGTLFQRNGYHQKFLPGSSRLRSFAMQPGHSSQPESEPRELKPQTGSDPLASTIRRTQSFVHIQPTPAMLLLGPTTEPAQWQLVNKQIRSDLQLPFAIFWSRAAQHYATYARELQETGLRYLALDHAVPERMVVRNRSDLRPFRKLRALWLRLDVETTSSQPEHTCWVVLLLPQRSPLRIATYLEAARSIGRKRTSGTNRIQLRKSSKNSTTSQNTGEQSLQIQSETLERIAHDLNKPLSNLFMTHASLKQELQANSALDADFRQNVLMRIDRMGLQMQEIHNYSQSLLHLQTGRAPGLLHQEEFFLVEYLDNLLDMFADQFDRAGVRVLRNFCVDFKIKIQRDLLGRILSNLLSNAAHFCARPGVLYLELRQEDRLWQFDIEDNGQGLHATDAMLELSRQNIGRQGGGWGLGLAGCVEMGRQLGGSLRSLAPRYGQGARFLLVLPVDSGQAGQGLSGPPP